MSYYDTYYIFTRHSQIFGSDVASIDLPEDILASCIWIQSNIETEPTTKLDCRKKVSFTSDTKEHDGQKPETCILEKLVVHYLQIGGMTSSRQMVCFLNTNSVSLSDTKVISSLKDRINDLADRLVKCNSFNKVPLLQEGGGTGYQIGLVALPNIKHLICVFETALKESV